MLPEPEGLGSNDEGVNARHDKMVELVETMMTVDGLRLTAYGQHENQIRIVKDLPKGPHGGIWRTSIESENGQIEKEESPRGREYRSTLPGFCPGSSEEGGSEGYGQG